jgi:hypothetical protein
MVDDHFYRMLLDAASRGTFTAGKRVQAYIMYKFVRAVGSIYWEGKE